MQNILKLIVICVPMCFITNCLQAQSTLSGKITDASTGETLPGANIYFPDLKTGTVSDANGNYSISDLPAKKELIQITYLGYGTVTETIDLSSVSTKDFQLKESVTEIKEVVITGLSQASEQNRTPTPVTVVTHQSLLQNSSTNIIDALAKEPGITQVTTGPAISKPQIRGLGYNRVVVVNDGIRQEGQQWGDEHGIEIDEFSINKVELLKGPASIAYGSDAMAGVINMLSAPTLPAGMITGHIIANYQTNNGLIGYSGNIAGNLNGFIWDARYSGKMAHDYQNKYDGYVFGSNFSEQAANVIIGVNKKWGYSHLHIDYYSLIPGIVEGERDSLTGNFIKPVAVNDSTEGTEITTDDDFHSYAAITPHQEIHHYKATLNNSFILGQGALNSILGFQQNNRQEFADVLAPAESGLYFKLNTINYDVRYLLPEKNNWQSSVGINGMKQKSLNEGIEFLVPAYDLFDIGIFAMTKKTINKLDVAGGIRYDSRNIKGDDLYVNENGIPVTIPDANSEQLFIAFNSTFSAISGSLGATYQFTDDFYGKLNFSRGFRAPNIGEIGANGVHEGTFRYEIGDPNLKAETSFQTDGAFGFSGTHISFEADIFNNSIENFIYLHKLNSLSGGDSIINAEGEDVTAFKYFQGSANLFGGEFSLDIHPHPLDWLHFENSFSFVNAVQLNATDSTKYLPFSPAPKLISELRAQFKHSGKSLANSYLKFQLENYFQQDHVFSAFGTETPTPGYTLLNFGLGTDIQSNKKTFFSVYISVNNLSDVAYQSHLSRLKYGAENYATGRTGVYDMGRNISIKINMPLYLKSS